MSPSILTVQVALTLRLGVIDWKSYGTAALLLVALLCWLGRPRSAMTYYVGGIALIACTVRTILTAWDRYHHHLANINNTQIDATMIVISLFMVVLTWNYLFAKSSRDYFLMDSTR